MPFINIPIGTAKEGEPVPEGEYDLRIIEFASHNTEKGDGFMGRALILSDEFPNAIPVQFYVGIPGTGDPDKTKQEFKRLLFERFLYTFNVPFESDGFNPEDVVGCQTVSPVRVTQREPDDTGTIYNEFRSLRLPKDWGE